jgi:hypothetical protein
VKTSRFSVLPSRISEIAQTIKPKTDWSRVRDELKSMEPGEAKKFACPAGMEWDMFRASLMTRARRMAPVGYVAKGHKEGSYLHVWWSLSGDTK